MSEYAACACLRVKYEPEDVEIQNPVTGKMVAGKSAKWVCESCGAEFTRVIRHDAGGEKMSDTKDREAAERLRGIGWRYRNAGDESAAEFLIDCADRIDELKADNKRLRRQLDNIKIRAYELGVKELHDMALKALEQ